MRRLNLGCGRKYMLRHINIDINPIWKCDLLRDITRGLPFDNSSVDSIHTSHLLEHIGPDDIHFVIREMWRVCKPKAHIRIVVPIGRGLMNFPEHKSFWNAKSWVFFTKWNFPPETGYQFKLVKQEVKNVGTDIDSKKEFYGEELHFTMEVVK